MPSYRFYKISAVNHVPAPGETRYFDRDSAALAYARTLADAHAIDVWQDTRFVEHVEPEHKHTTGTCPAAGQEHAR
jgi:hypothetical protein